MVEEFKLLGLNTNSLRDLLCLDMGDTPEEKRIESERALESLAAFCRHLCEYYSDRSRAARGWVSEAANLHMSGDINLAGMTPRGIFSAVNEGMLCTRSEGLHSASRDTDKPGWSL